MTSTIETTIRPYLVDPYKNYEAPQYAVECPVCGEVGRCRERYRANDLKLQHDRSHAA